MLGMNFLMPEAVFGQHRTLPTQAFFSQGSIGAVLTSCPPHWQGFLPSTAVVPSLANVTQKQEATGCIVGGQLLLSATFIAPRMLACRCAQTRPNGCCRQITRSRRWLYRGQTRSRLELHFSVVPGLVVRNGSVSG